MRAKSGYLVKYPKYESFEFSSHKRVNIFYDTIPGFNLKTKHQV
jgi:hypothetical protein